MSGQLQDTTVLPAFRIRRENPLCAGLDVVAKRKMSHLLREFIPSHPVTLPSTYRRQATPFAATISCASFVDCFQIVRIIA